MLVELARTVEKLQTERTRLLAILESAGEAQRRVPVYDEGWNLYDLISHIASAEKENVRFLRQVLAEDGARHVPRERVFSLDEWNAQAVGKRAGLSWEQRMAELAEVRRNTLAAVESVTAEQLTHSGTHAVWGEKSVEALLKIVYLHDIMHRNDVARKLST